MSRHSDWLADFSAAIAERRWNACPRLLYRVLYGLPATDLLPLTGEAIQRYVPFFEGRWPGVTWPREIISNPQKWIERFGRALPDEPQTERISDARFIFSLDALLLAWSHPTDVSILTSSCACGIREAVGAIVQETAGAEDMNAGAQECEGCATPQKSRTQPPDPESPIEFAYSREWQNILDMLIARNVHTYPDVPSTEYMEADLAEWERHAMLLIVPEAASLFTQVAVPLQEGPFLKDS
jgi:hypothetical protein